MWPGDALLLTKALGVGAVLAATLRGDARGRWYAAAAALMAQSNGALPRETRPGGGRAARLGWRAAGWRVV